MPLYGQSKLKKKKGSCENMQPTLNMQAFTSTEIYIIQVVFFALASYVLYHIVKTYRSDSED